MLDRLPEFEPKSYLPVRAHTPSLWLTLNKELAENGIRKEIKDYPMVANVGKIIDALEDENDSDTKHKAHGLTPDDVINLIKKLQNPEYVVYQEKNGRIGAVVTIRNAQKRKIAAIVELGEPKNPVYLNGYVGGGYNVVVTFFSPTGDNYLNDDRNIILYDKKGTSQRGSGSFVPSHLKDVPFADSLADENKKVNTSQRNSTEDSDGNALTAEQQEDDYIRYSREMDEQAKVNFGSMFSGTGTVDFALRNMVNHRFAVEYDRQIAGVFKSNNGDEIFIGDVRDAVKQGYLDDKEVEYFHASPVCKNFSSQKHDSGEQPLDISTAQAVADAIDSLGPKIFTLG